MPAVRRVSGPLWVLLPGRAIPGELGRDLYDTAKVVYARGLSGSSGKPLTAPVLGRLGRYGMGRILVIQPFLVVARIILVSSAHLMRVPIFVYPTSRVDLNSLTHHALQGPHHALTCIIILLY